MFYACVMVALIFTFLTNFVDRESVLVRRFILLLPSTTLFLDESLERQIRLLGVSDKWI